jgi:hypothetical protein
MSGDHPVSKRPRLDPSPDVSIRVKFSSVSSVFQGKHAFPKSISLSFARTGVEEIRQAQPS